MDTGRPQKLFCPGSRVGRWGIVLLAVLLLQTGRADAGEPVAAPGVSYLKGGAVEIRGSVLPMTGEGIVCYACGLVRIRVDGKEIPFEIRPGRENAAEVVGKVSGLGDGPHTATEEILEPVSCKYEHTDQYQYQPAHGGRIP